MLREDIGASATCVWAEVMELISDLSLAMVMSLFSRDAISSLILLVLALSLLARACLDASWGGVANFPPDLSTGAFARTWLEASWGGVVNLPLDLGTGAWTRKTALGGELSAVDSIVAQDVVVVVTAALAAAGGWSIARAGLEKAELDIVEVKGEDGDGLGTTEEVGTGLDTVADVETGLGTNLKLPKGLIMFPSSSVAAILFGIVLCQLTPFLEHKTKLES